MTRHLESQLGVDLGTTHTVAVLSAADGRAQPLLFDASFLLPSSVFAEVDGHLLVGRDAERSARLNPGRFEPNPKRRIDEGRVLLGSRDYAVSELLSALLRRTADEAARVLGVMPARTVLTYPANWASHRRSVLADAAARAGMPAPTQVPEPIAAAVYFTTVLGRTVPPGGVLVVFDFGGGTFDTSVLRRSGDGWDVLATDGLPDVGGVDLDAAVISHLGHLLAAADPQRWRQLVEPGDDAALRRSLLLREDARTAKEQLSRAATAGIHVPLFDTDVHITRDEFERAARPYLQRTVDLTANTLQRAGVRPDQISGLFLVGGSSRIPLVSTLLHQRLGIAPTLIEQPELVVALGSVLATMPVGPTALAPRSPVPPASPPPMPAPVSGPGPIPVSGVGAALPVSPGASPASPPMWIDSIPPEPGTPVSAPPSAAPPRPLAASAGVAPRRPAVPGGSEGAQQPSDEPTVVVPALTQRARPGGGRKTALLVGVVVAVLLLGAGGVQAWRTWADDGSTRDSSAPRDGAGVSAPSAGDGHAGDVPVGNTSTPTARATSTQVPTKPSTTPKASAANPSNPPPATTATQTPNRVAVPNLDGLSPTDADNLLRAKGLTKGTVTYTGGGAPCPKVVAQDPGAGTMVPPGTAVSYLEQFCD